jgi:hypothetical protein
MGVQTRPASCEGEGEQGADLTAFPAKTEVYFDLNLVFNRIKPAQLNINFFHIALSSPQNGPLDRAEVQPHI